MLYLAFVVGGIWILKDMLKLLRFFRVSTESELSTGGKAATLGLIVAGTLVGSVIAYHGLDGLLANLGDKT